MPSFTIKVRAGNYSNIVEVKKAEDEEDAIFQVSEWLKGQIKDLMYIVSYTVIHNIGDDDYQSEG